MKLLIIIFMLTILTEKNCGLLNPIQEFIEIEACTSDIFYMFTK